MYGNKGLPSRNYSYGAKRPTKNFAAVFNQMRLANDFRNALITLELERRKATDLVLAELVPAFVPAREAYFDAVDEEDALYENIRDLNQEARKRVDNQALVIAHAAAKKVRLKASAAFKAVKDEAFARADVKERQKPIEADYKEGEKVQANAMRKLGMQWSTLTFVINSNNLRKGRPPKHRSWDGNGTLALQTQGGQPWAAVTGGRCRQVQFAGVDPHPRRKNWTIVRFRVGSAEHGRPIWAELPAKIHRPVPPDAQIRFVYLHRHIVGREVRVQDKQENYHRHIHGGREQWTVRFALVRGTGWQKPDNAETGVAAVNFGWRKVPGGLRVATLVSEDGHQEHLVIPNDRLGMYDKADAIQSVRDTEFDRMRERLQAFRDDKRIRKPKWWRAKTKNLGKWKSPNGMAALYWQWLLRRFKGDEQIVAELNDWRAARRSSLTSRGNDGHYARYAQGLRDGYRGWRKDYYRNWVASVRRRFKTVIIDDTKLASFCRNKKLVAAHETDGAKYTREMRRRAGLYGLKAWFGETATELVVLSSTNISKRCHVCGKLSKTELVKGVQQVCGKCGAEWDQDVNACRNLLHKYEQQLQAAGEPASV